MLAFLPSLILGVLGFITYVINTLFWIIPVLVFAFCKAILPFSFSRACFSYLLDLMATGWITVNTLNQRLFIPTKLNVIQSDVISKENWYLVIANHQSWVDILVLQRVLNGQAPFLKFFLKSELIWVPILGLAWWALDFPFMKRFSSAYLAKNPQHKGKDIEATRKACEKFKTIPVSVMNFVEGTRFTQAKHAKQQSPFDYLLKPKAGGVAFVLNAMQDSLTHILDVTIHYPDGIPTFWQFVSGRVKTVDVHIDVLPITEELQGDYFDDEAFKTQFQQWMNSIWQQKDQRLRSLQIQSEDE